MAKTRSHSAREEETSAYILVVEDDQALRKLLYDAFRTVGNRCFVIRSKISSKQFLRQVRPDLVVLDYQLIGGVGLEAAEIASEMKVPVIVTSGYVNMFDRVQKTGYFFLRKPFTLSEMLDLASMLLGTNLRLSVNPQIQLH